jgi:hypothetical protein
VRGTLRGSIRGASLRTIGAFAIGFVILAGILYVASTVDARPPTVERIGLTHHLSADDGVALTTTSIEVVFSETVDRASAQGAFSISPTVAGAFSWTGATMTFTPAERLPLETDFVVRVAGGVRDPGGNVMTTPLQLAFLTVGHPTVVGSQPQPNAADVALTEPIVLQFSTLMDTASVEDALSVAPEIELTPAWSGERLTLTPVQPLAEGERYTVRLAATARDSAGTPLEGPYTLSFAAVRSGLSAQIRFPANDVEGISPASPIAIMFDRALDPGSVQADELVIEPSVPGSLAVVAAPGAAGMRDPAARVLRFLPSGPLAPNTTYRVTLQPGVTGVDGSGLASPISWRFTTGSPSASLSNQIVFLSQRAGIANLWAMNADGSGLRQLSAELSPVDSYALAPDGRSFVVGDGAILVRQGTDGRGRQVLTEEGVLEADPSYAPNGAEIAFARIDAETGGGLGLWTRPATGGDASQLQMPRESGATPTPAASGVAEASGEAPLQPVLRAPRYSPDGSALAFVDVSGRVGILELERGRLTTARFAAVDAPEWLPDSSGILLAGSPGGALEPVVTRQPLPPFDPGSLRLSSFALGGLRLAHLDRGAAAVRLLDQVAGAARPEAGEVGRYLFVQVQPGAPGAAGSLMLSDASDRASEMLSGGGPPVISAGFGPQPRILVAARLDAGVWLVDIATGQGTQLSTEGWLPTWLP